MKSANGLIYARTFYLDNLAAGWDALIGHDYNWVMPLTHRRKFGFSYLYQPPFTQQSGVFYKLGVTVPYNEIVQYLERRYRFWDFNWNYLTPADFAASPVKITAATNFVLDLYRNYESIADRYQTDLVKNLKKSSRAQFSYQTTDDYNKCIRLYREHYGSRMLHLKDRDYKNFAQLCSYAQKHEMLVCREAVDEHREPMATALLLTDGKRLYNLMNTTTEPGRKTAANHFLVDAIIQEFSGREMVLDFEGSDLPGVKSFYENFSPINQPYFICRYNNLPWPVKIFKK